MNFQLEKIRRSLEELQARIVKDREKIEGIRVCTCGYKNGKNSPPEDAEWRDFRNGETFGGSFEWHGWFRVTVKIPERMKHADGEIELYNWCSRGNPQLLTYIDGKTICGQDKNHQTLPLDREKDSFELLTYVYAGYNSDVSEYIPELRLIDTDTKKLYWNIKVPYDAMCCSDPDSTEFYDIRKVLIDTLNIVDFRTCSEEYTESVRKAIDWLDENFYHRICQKQPSTCICTGHTHIDVAWLWPLRQTREKAQRSFSTVVNMMKEFPEYKFMSSQPQLYQFVKEDDPALYEEIRQLVKAGRWEVEGAMWLEADCNLTSGESLIRQILFGKRFIKEEFGKDSKVLWLPDVFGYSAALPQILTKSGVTRFVTSKISWNETNKMPYDVFNWTGIDGSKIFSYFLTAQDWNPDADDFRATYSGTITPKMVKGTWARFQQKDIAREVINAFGHGDGGGGPTREMMETGTRLQKGIPGCPDVQFGFVGDFLDRLEDDVKNNPQLPEWVGELYLEYHRGTYTSMAKNKLKNRRSEFLYQNAETANVIAHVLKGSSYPQQRLNDGWRKILLCQFHDIIPGSSIKEVYEDSDRIYEEVMEEGQTLLQNAAQTLASAIGTDGGVLVFNPNPFSGSAPVTVNGKTCWVNDIPAKGWRVVHDPVYNTTAKADIECRILENDYVRVQFDLNFEIVSLYDKRSKREVVPTGEKGNVLQAFEDYPKKWDAWEITNYYKEKMWSISGVESAETYEDGIYVGFRVRRRFQNSVIEQCIRISDRNACVDFVTMVDWKNDHILLKAAFPTTVRTGRATYEIQYGNVERPTHSNTSWDQAKFEVCAHKWADLSEYGFGVSLMNDCKYGYDISGSTIRLTLLKSATYPNPDADKEVHHFTYTIYPHSGDYRDAETVQLAYQMNNPLQGMVIPAQKGALPDTFSAVSCSEKNIFTDVLKKAEDDDSLILRLYDAFNTTTEANLTFGFPVRSVELCDMMEHTLSPLETDGRTVKVPVKPFEIVTLKLNL